MTSLYLQWRDEQKRKDQMENIARDLGRRDSRTHEGALGRLVRVWLGVC